MNKLQINIVPDEGCPRCGVTGSPKVWDSQNLCWWKCLNPDCTVGYWCPERGNEIEERASEEELRAIAERIRKEMEGITFIQVGPNEWQGVKG